VPSVRSRHLTCPNSVIEKYCYNNEVDSCAKYGGLYQWDEMMQYTTAQGVRGICPLGWHVPTDEEWKVLEGAVDIQYGISDVEWDSSFTDRGYDAGLNLKTIIGWYSGGNGTDLFGFSGLPSGFRSIYGGCNGIDYNSYWWMSTVGINNGPLSRYLSYDIPGVYRYDLCPRGNGVSVRCLKDN
jgi:uncharacterized protein (TIGR02145 family)